MARHARALRERYILLPSTALLEELLQRNSQVLASFARDRNDDAEAVLVDALLEHAVWNHPNSLRELSLHKKPGMCLLAIGHRRIRLAQWSRSGREVAGWEEISRTRAPRATRTPPHTADSLTEAQMRTLLAKAGSEARFSAGRSHDGNLDPRAAVLFGVRSSSDEGVNQVLRARGLLVRIPDQSLVRQSDRDVLSPEGWATVCDWLNRHAGQIVPMPTIHALRGGPDRPVRIPHTNRRTTRTTRS